MELATSKYPGDFLTLRTPYTLRVWWQYSTGDDWKPKLFHSRRNARHRGWKLPRQAWEGPWNSVSRSTCTRKLARDGDKVLACPYSVRGMDVSYSGLYTYLKNKISTERREDVAFNAQEYAFTALAEIVERGMAHFGLTEFSITGGVARNRRLRKLLQGMAKMRGYRYYFPDDKLLSDNGAMIALAGYMSNLTSDENVKFLQMDRVDSRKSNWIGSRKLTPRAMVGGESVVKRSKFQGMDCVVKGEEVASIATLK